MTTTDVTARDDAIRIGGFALPRRFAVLGGVLTAVFILFHYRGFGLLVERWNTDSNYGHGFLIPFISLYFVWSRKEALARLRPEPSAWVIWAGAALVFASFVPWFLAIPINSVVLAGWAVVLMANGLILLLGGLNVWKALWLPALYLAFMVPLPQRLYEAFAGPLQLFASWTSAGILERLFHIPLLRDGNVIRLAGNQLQVAEACSGMRSIMGLLALGVAFGYFWERDRWERILLVVSTVPIAIFANICRVTGTGLLYNAGHARFAQGFYHEFTGWSVFLFAMALFLLEAWLLSKIFIYHAPSAGDGHGMPCPDEGKESGGRA